MTPLHALPLVFALAAAPSATPAPTASTIPTEPSTVRGRLFVLTPTYLVFTTGDAVPITPDAHIAPALRLGQTIRVRFDPPSHHVRSIEPASGPLEHGEIDAALLPRAYAAISPASAHTTQNAKSAAQARSITVTFVVRVPDDTPATDDVYLSTEHSNFSPAELKMNRIDAHAWSTTLPLVEGTTLHYQYTRGNYANIERDDGGGIVTPRAVEVHEGARTGDTVARWADAS